MLNRENVDRTFYIHHQTHLKEYVQMELPSNIELHLLMIDVYERALWRKGKTLTL